MKIVGDWWNVIHKCTHDQFDFAEIDLSSQTHLEIWLTR